MLRRFLSTSSSRWAPALPRELAALRRLEQGTELELRAARAWITALGQMRVDQVPRDGTTLSFVRSSGPGGQNVNKLSTKCLLRLSLSPPPAWIAPYALERLRLDRAYARDADELQFSSSRERSQRANEEDCWEKLLDRVRLAASEGIPGATKEGKQERVVRLQAREKRAVTAQKKQRKDVKAGRRAGWD